MHLHRISWVLGGLLLAGCGGSAAPSAQAPAAPAPEGRIVQAGAPGESTRAWDGSSMSRLEGTEYTATDVAFMQGMIHHHAQALEMTALIPERTERDAIRQMGLRMEISQADEIGLMEKWLEEHGEEVPEWSVTATSMDHGMDHDMDHAMGSGGMQHDAMPGMLTPDQMARLEAARDTEFDRLFLEFMIQHHEGALTMVRDLYNTPGAAQESTVYKFASEVDADQDIEIRRMRQLLDTLR